jgi:hypothetical protein
MFNILTKTTVIYTLLQTLRFTTAIPFLFNTEQKLFENCSPENVVKRQFGGFTSKSHFQQWVRNSFQTTKLTLEKYVKERDVRLQETSERTLTSFERNQIEQLFSMVFGQLDADKNGIFEFDDLRKMDCRQTANSLIKLNKQIEQLKEKIKNSVAVVKKPSQGVVEVSNQVQGLEKKFAVMENQLMVQQMQIQQQKIATVSTNTGTYTATKTWSDIVNGIIGMIRANSIVDLYTQGDELKQAFEIDVDLVGMPK